MRPRMTGDALEKGQGQIVKCPLVSVVPQEGGKWACSPIRLPWGCFSGLSHSVINSYQAGTWRFLPCIMVISVVTMTTMGRVPAVYCALHGAFCLSSPPLHGAERTTISVSPKRRNQEGLGWEHRQQEWSMEEGHVPSSVGSSIAFWVVWLARTRTLARVQGATYGSGSQEGSTSSVLQDPRLKEAAVASLVGLGLLMGRQDQWGLAQESGEPVPAGSSSPPGRTGTSQPWQEDGETPWWTANLAPVLWP